MLDIERFSFRLFQPDHRIYLGQLTGRLEFKEVPDEELHLAQANHHNETCKGYILIDEELIDLEDWVTWEDSEDVENVVKRRSEDIIDMMSRLGL